MSLLASEVMDETAAVYLNDSQKLNFGYAVQLPYLKSAVGELQSLLESNDLPNLHEYSATLTIAPGVTQIVPPSDMTLPIALYERAPGETHWEKMDETSWEPDVDRDGELHVWVYREGLVQLLGSTATREIRLRYVRSLSTIGSENSTIEVSNAKGFLAARTAALISTFGGSATARGIAANERANEFRRLILGTLTKRLQSRPVRRRRYRWRN